MPAWPHPLVTVRRLSGSPRIFIGDRMVEPSELRARNTSRYREPDTYRQIFDTGARMRLSPLPTATKFTASERLAAVPSTLYPWINEG